MSVGSPAGQSLVPEALSIVQPEPALLIEKIPSSLAANKSLPFENIWEIQSPGTGL